MICYDLQLTLKMQVWRGWTEKNTNLNNITYCTLYHN